MNIAKLSDLSLNITVGFVGSMSKYFINYGVPLLRGQNIKPYQLDLTNLKYIPLEIHKKWKKSSLKAGDVVLVRVGYPGTACVIPCGLGELNAASLVIVRPDIEKLDSNYLCYVLNSTLGKENIQARLVGAAQQVFNVKDAAELEIPFPPKSTQLAISSILGAFDDLVEVNLTRIGVLEEVARLLYEEWFVNLRYPGHEDAEIIETPHGPTPKGWKWEKIKHFGKIITGKTPPKINPENYDNYIPFIKTPDMHNSIFCIKTSEMLSKKGMMTQRNQTLPPDSICVSCIGTTGIVAITSIESQTNQQINSIILNDLKFREFLYFSLKALKPTIELHGATGATMTNLSKGKFSNLMTILPPDEVMEEYHLITKPIFDEIHILQKKNGVLKELRDLLLPKLISGEIDVSYLDIQT